MTPSDASQEDRVDASARRRPRRAVVAPLALLAGGLALSLGAAALAHRADEDQRREAVRADLVPVAAELSRALSGALQLMEGLACLIEVEGGLTPARFEAFADGLLRRDDLIRSVAVAPDNVVRFVHPLAGNEQALGLDYARTPAQWPGVERMIRERRLVVAGPVALVQGGVGVIGRAPVHVRDGAGRRYWGLSSTVVELERLLARTSLAAAGARLDVALRGADGRGAGGAPFWGDPGVFARAPVLVDVPLPTGSWQLGAAPRGGWPPLRPARAPLLLAGGLLSLVLAALLRRLLLAGDALERARAELEARVAARTRQLQAAKDAAEAADRLKSTFLATMSHELRTPLNSIIGFTGIISMGMAGPLTDEQSRQLGMVTRSARHLLALINDLLDLSKIEAGQLQLVVEPFDLPALVERAVAALRPQATQKGLSLELELGPGLGEVTSDPRRVEQVLLNLLSNAVKFTERGGVRVVAAADGPRVEVEVVDTGPGIAPEAQGLLFRPFSQLDAGLERRHEGTGLGLSICKRLVEALGGEVRVRSAPGQGSAFGFSLPRAPGPVSSPPGGAPG